LLGRTCDPLDPVLIERMEHASGVQGVTD
jgi:hypothetical protein